MITCHHQQSVFEEKEITDTETGDWRLDPRRYSSWVHLVGVYARVQRVVNNMQKAEKELAGSCYSRKDEMLLFKKILFAQHNKKVFNNLIILKFILRNLHDKMIEAYYKNTKR